MLLVTEKRPEALPLVLGVNLSVSTIEFPGGIAAPVGLAVNTGRLPTMPVIFSVSVPVLEMVTVVSLNFPRGTEPKCTLGTLKARIGYGAVPVTDTSTVPCNGSLVVNRIVAPDPPPVGGWK